MKPAIPFNRIQIRKIVLRPTVQMQREELDIMLSVDTAIGQRDAVHHRPTMQMEAVKVPA